MMMMDMKPKQRAKATAAELDKSDRRKWSALIESAIRDAENDIIARLSEKFESQTDPLSLPSAAALVREMYRFRPERPDDGADRNDARGASTHKRKAALTPRRT
jgi:hypothetical protein